MLVILHLTVTDVDCVRKCNCPVRLWYKKVHIVTGCHSLRNENYDNLGCSYNRL